MKKIGIIKKWCIKHDIDFDAEERNLSSDTIIEIKLCFTYCCASEEFVFNSYKDINVKKIKKHLKKSFGLNQNDPQIVSSKFYINSIDELTNMPPIVFPKNWHITLDSEKESYETMKTRLLDLKSEYNAFSKRNAKSVLMHPDTEKVFIEELKRVENINPVRINEIYGMKVFTTKRIGFGEFEFN